MKKGFRIIALRTPEWCRFDDKDMLKVLEPKTIYPFYNCYSYHGSSNPLDEMHYHPELDPELYQLPDVPVNISAIVGSNGSGKSTLIMLLVCAAYNMGAVLKLLYKPDGTKDKLNPDAGFNLEIIFESHATPTDPEAKKKDSHLYQLFFTNGEVFLLPYEQKGTQSNQYILDDPQGDPSVGSKPLLDREMMYTCFYSILVNYSHYAMNSEETGIWINALFHKNDGYQTPLVINPMRNKGNIDINREKQLLNQRLLSNILEPVPKGSKNNLRVFAEGKVARSLSIKLDTLFVELKIGKYDPKEEDINDFFKRVNQMMYELWTNDTIIEALIQQFDLNLRAFSMEERKDPLVAYGVGYMFYKIQSIATRYPQYELSSQDFGTTVLIYADFIKQLKGDESHVAFKVKQTIYFLKHLQRWKERFLGDKDYCHGSLDKFSDFIEEIKQLETTDVLPTIALIPPPIFQTEIHLKGGLEFDGLSSGERQKIFSISSIAYHIINLNSVQRARLINGDHLIKYRNIQIIFDEIELYYHPEWQRRFIGDLIDYLGKLDPIYTNDIEGINFLFITHSPFILSDIPRTNILALSREEPDNIESKALPSPLEKDTFGANIHELLSDGFFLKEGFIGEHARKVISELRKYLVSKDAPDEEKGWNRERADHVININGEPLIQRHLRSLFYKKFGESREDLERKMADLQRKLDNLK